MLNRIGVARIIGLLAIAAFVSVSNGSAVTSTSISGNFCSVANVQNPPAGVHEAVTWNDFTAVAGFGGFGSTSNVFYDGGLFSGATVSWGGSGGVSQNTNDNVQRPADIDDGHDEMMTGYLQASKFGPTGYVPMINLSVSGLDVAAFGGAYDLILYFDGDGDVEGPSGAAAFSVSGGPGRTAPMFFGRDAGDQYALQNDGADPASVYTQITSTDPQNPTVGNYVRFTGLTDTSFVATMTGMLDEQGVALNGFQIVPVPEPATWLLACGTLLFLRRR